MRRAGAIGFVALLVASVVAAGAVVRARSPDLELQVLRLTPRFSPTGGGEKRVAHIRFFVRDSDPDATVEIVGPNLEHVRTLYRGPLVADRRVAFTWDGRTSAGRLASALDNYRLRVILPAQDRDMVYPRRIELRLGGTLGGGGARGEGGSAR